MMRPCPALILWGVYERRGWGPKVQWVLVPATLAETRTKAIARYGDGPAHYTRERRLGFARCVWVRIEQAQEVAG